MTLNDLRAGLAALSDAELLQRCITDICAQRRLRSDKRLDRFREECWAECVRRDRRDVWMAALKGVVEREREERR